MNIKKELKVIYIIFIKKMHLFFALKPLIKIINHKKFNCS